jgi:two-component system, OmpR family, sensor kinase
VLVLAVVALEVPLASSVADRIDAEVESQAFSQADVVAASVADLLGPGAARDRERLVDAAAETVRGRVIVVDAQGDLLADSEGAPPGRSYAGRPEIAAALDNRRVQRERSSETLGQTLLVTAVPVVSGRDVTGAVRVSQSVEAVDRAVRRAWVGLVLIGLLVLGLGLLAGSIVAGQIARPIGRLDRAARRVAEGELATRAAVEGSSEQRSLAATFNDMTARLERLVRSQRDFVADASHQLRTPLTGLRLRVEAARAESREPAVDEELDAALAELDRLGLMIDELLQLSRAGEAGTAGERLPLPQLAAHAAERWEATAAERDQRLRATGAGEGAAWMSREDADRILDALVENALAYSPAGTEVEVVVLPNGLEVRDRGPGLAAGEEEQVFERFHRGGAGRRGVPGTGLGLPIARELARRWGGDVTLSRRDGGGTVAEVLLPPA